MQRFQKLTRCAFASAMIWLGVMGLAIHKFAPIWGPLPAWAPWPTALTIVCSVIPLVAGIALLFRRTQATASLVLFVYIAIWWLLLNVPPVFRAPLSEVTWLDCGMRAMLLAGAWTLYATFHDRPFPGGERGLTLARLLFGVGLIPTGISHFVYVGLTVPLIPGWFPFRLGLAYFTGACHIAAGLGILFGVLPLLAAQLETLMLLIFTVVVWIPRVITAPTTRGNWTEIWLSWAITVAAAVIAAHIPPRSPRQLERKH